MPFRIDLGPWCLLAASVLALAAAVSTSAQQRPPLRAGAAAAVPATAPPRPTAEQPVQPGTMRAQSLPQPGTAQAGAPAPETSTFEEPRFPDTSLWYRGRIAAYERSLAVPMQPIAILEVPRLALRVAVFPGTDDVTLDRGVGHLTGTAAPGSDGNVAIAGHRDGYFRVLKNVEPGDVMRLVTPGGSREYVVAATWIVNPEQVEVLSPTPQPALTLIACYPFYYPGHAPQRFIVRAHETVTAG